MALRRFDMSLNALAKQKLFAKTMNEGCSCEVGEMDAYLEGNEGVPK